MREPQKQPTSNPERIRERAKTPETPRPEQADDDTDTVASDIGEQPRDRDLMPGETLREPNAPADSSAGDY